MKTINVKGVARLSKSPDTVEINLTIVTLESDYKVMMEEASKKVDVLTYQLINIGFDKKDIKTTSFVVNSKYEINNNNSKFFLGYEARQSIILRFPIDLNLLGDILEAISTSISKPEIFIRFTIKDENIFTDELLNLAIQDAISKANVIAKASNVRLGEIQTINYNWQDHVFYSPTSIQPENLKFYSARIDFVPENIVISDSIQVSFEIL